MIRSIRTTDERIRATMILYLKREPTDEDREDSSLLLGFITFCERRASLGLSTAKAAHAVDRVFPFRRPKPRKIPRPYCVIPLQSRRNATANGDTK